MKYTLGELQKKIDDYGNLDLSCCENLTTLPEGLSVGGNLYLSGCTGLTALADGLTVGGNLDLSGCTGLTALPDGLSVGGNLDLSYCPNLTTLPDGLVVGGWLNLRGCTGITTLPDGLVVGGVLDFWNTSICTIPNNIVVGEICGNGLVSENDFIKLKNGDYINGCISVNRKLIPITGSKNKNGYVFYMGKNPKENVIFNGKSYAICESFEDGMKNLKTL